MAKGVLSGVIWGGVVSLAGAAVLSVLTEGPMPPDVSDRSPGSATVPVEGELAETAPTPRATILDKSPDSGQATSQTPQPAPDTLTALERADTAPAAVPQTGSVDGLSTPARGQEQSGVALDEDMPVLPSPQAMAPQAPGAEAELSISTDPAQPPAPAEIETEAFAAPEPDLEAAPAPRLEEPVPDDAGATQSVIEPDAPKIDVQPEIAEPIAPTVDDVPARGALPQATGGDDTGQTGLSIGRPSGTLGAAGQGVVVNRLPNLGDPATDPDPEALDKGEVLPDQDPRPLVRFGAPFEGSEGKPLMSIVLIDSGQDLSGGSVGLAALRSFPYPVSFAVDANLPDATERMEGYRAQGFEVLAMVDLPKGATATDAEVSLAAALSAVPEAVAVIEGTATGVQTTREAADQVTAILAQTGHGFVTQNQGLNTVQKLAAKAGVPAAVVFRDFDSKGQTPTVIRRFLDQAAFRAGQDGKVIMLGRIRPDTISALLLWALQDRAEQVALAPVSALLMAEQP